MLQVLTAALNIGLKRQFKIQKNKKTKKQKQNRHGKNFLDFLFGSLLLQDVVHGITKLQ